MPEPNNAEIDRFIEKYKRVVYGHLTVPGKDKGTAVRFIKPDIVADGISDGDAEEIAKIIVEKAYSELKQQKTPEELESFKAFFIGLAKGTLSVNPDKNNAINNIEAELTSQNYLQGEAARRKAREIVDTASSELAQEEQARQRRAAAPAVSQPPAAQHEAAPPKPDDTSVFQGLGDIFEEMLKGARRESTPPPTPAPPAPPLPPAPATAQPPQGDDEKVYRILDEFMTEYPRKKKSYFLKAKNELKALQDQNTEFYGDYLTDILTLLMYYLDETHTAATAILNTEFSMDTSFPARFGEYAIKLINEHEKNKRAPAQPPAPASAKPGSFRLTVASAPAKGINFKIHADKRLPWDNENRTTDAVFEELNAGSYRLTFEKFPGYTFEKADVEGGVNGIRQFKNVFKGYTVDFNLAGNAAITVHLKEEKAAQPPVPPAALETAPKKCRLTVEAEHGENIKFSIMEANSGRPKHEGNTGNETTKTATLEKGEYDILILDEEYKNRYESIEAKSDDVEILYQGSNFTGNGRIVSISLKGGGKITLHLKKRATPPPTPAPPAPAKPGSFRLTVASAPAKGINFKISAVGQSVRDIRNGTTDAVFEGLKAGYYDIALDKKPGYTFESADGEGGVEVMSHYKTSLNDRNVNFHLSGNGKITLHLKEEKAEPPMPAPPLPPAPATAQPPQGGDETVEGILRQFMQWKIGYFRARDELENLSKQNPYLYGKRLFSLLDVLAHYQDDDGDAKQAGNLIDTGIRIGDYSKRYGEFAKGIINKEEEARRIAAQPPLPAAKPAAGGETTPPQAPPAAPEAREPWEPKENLKEQADKLQKRYNIEDKSVGTFAMAPFWLACAAELPAALAELSRQAGGISPGLKTQWDDALSEIRSILDDAAKQLDKDAYVKNISRLWASFNHDSTPLEQSEQIVRRAVQNLSGVLLGAEPAYEKMGQIEANLKDRRSSIGVGLAFLLPDNSFDIINEHKTGAEAGLGKQLAWLLIARSMDEYIDRHYGGRMIGDYKRHYPPTDAQADAKAQQPAPLAPLPPQAPLHAPAPLSLPQPPPATPAQPVGELITEQELEHIEQALAGELIWETHNNRILAAPFWDSLLSVLRDDIRRSPALVSIFREAADRLINTAGYRVHTDKISILNIDEGKVKSLLERGVAAAKTAARENLDKATGEAIASLREIEEKCKNVDFTHYSFTLYLIRVFGETTDYHSWLCVASPLVAYLHEFFREKIYGKATQQEAAESPELRQATDEIEKFVLEFSRFQEKRVGLRERMKKGDRETVISLKGEFLGHQARLQEFRSRLTGLLEKLQEVSGNG